MRPVGEKQEPVPLPGRNPGLSQGRDNAQAVHKDPAVNTFYYSITKDMKPVVLFRKLISKHPIESKSYFIKITDCVANN